MDQNATLTDHTVAIYSTHQEAEAAIRGLKDGGFKMKNLSIIGQHLQTEEHPVGFVNTGDRMWSWGKYGAFWGTMWGLLFGSAMLVIPAIGPVMIAGWIVAAVQGALVGGGIAALAGALASIGIPENTLVKYEAAIKTGSFLVLAHGSEEEIYKAKEILSQTPNVELESFSSARQKDVVLR